MKKLFVLLLVAALFMTGAVAETLTVASSCDFPPYEYYSDETGEKIGIEVEIVNKIAEMLGMDAEITDMQFDSIIAAVSSGKMELGVSGFTVTEERKQSVDFTVSYTTAQQSILVPEGSPITSVDDLFDPGVSYRICVQQGTTGDLYITDDIEANGLTHEVERFNKYGDAVASLLAGKNDCMIVDDQVAIAFAKSNEGLTVLETAYVLEDYAFCLAKDSALYEPVNNALITLMEDGTVQAIIDSYISAD